MLQRASHESVCVLILGVHSVWLVTQLMALIGRQEANTQWKTNQITGGGNLTWYTTVVTRQRC
jgi:hypothetical protein